MGTIAENIDNVSLAKKTLNVILFQEGDCWIAQGLQIDYVAYDVTIEKAISNFEKGFIRTIQENLKLRGSIEGVFTPAPADIWDQYYQPNNKFIAVSSFNDGLDFSIDFLKKAA